MGHRIQRVCCFICCIILIVTGSVFSASAVESKDSIVRVGSFEEIYNTVNEKGERSGYGYEYLRNIAGYAGWKYEYISSSWDNCFAQLEKGDMDLLGGISYTKERAEKMLFSDMPMGEEKYYIYTNSANGNLSADNLDSFEGKNIGVLLDHIPEDVLKKWEAKNRLKLKHIDVSTTEEIMNKLNKKEIDCFVSVESSTWADLGISPVTYIGESEIYFAINKNRPDIKAKLDNAMRRIKDDNPFYTEDLYKRYLSAQSSAFLSKKEKEWLGKHGAINIGYLNDDIGVSVVNRETGELEGVIIDYVNIAKDCLQGRELEFMLKGYDTRDEQLKALHNGEIDLIFHVSQNPYSAERNGFILSDTVWTFNIAAITSSKSFDENKKNIVAVPKDSIALKSYILYNYPQWSIDEYETMKEVIRAVKDGKADCFGCNSGLVANYIKHRKLNSTFLTKTANVSFGIKPEEPLLLSIMNKTLRSIPTEKLSGAVVSYSNSMRKVTAVDFVKDNMIIVTSAVTVIFVLILLLILSLLRKSKYAETEAKKAASRALELNNKLEENKRELQKALTEAQSANKAKTSFLANMSHDIRTPINGIVGMLAVIQKSENNPERIKYCLDKIEDSSKLLLALINDVLELAKLESDTISVNDESVNLEQVCFDMTKSLSFQAEEAGLTVTTECEDCHGIYVRSSAVYLKKILMNLFTNSMKYNKPNGSVNVGLRILEKTDEDIVCEFKISDTGIGMTEEFIQNELFEPFVQADDSARSTFTGTGLGMAGVKKLLAKMGGSIDVKSKLGEGTCFTVVIPFKLDTERICDAEPFEADIDDDISELRILLVEDNELNMEIAEFIFEDCGVNVEKALNGEEAVSKFEASEEGYYDAVMMDIMMPVMNGLIATKTIRSLNRPDAKTVPIVAMTANAFKEDADMCFDYGMNAHITKPLDIKMIKSVIAQFCVNNRR